MAAFADYISEIRSKLEKGAPGETYQLQMAPAHRRATKHYLQQGSAYRNASVTALLVPDSKDGQPSVLLVQRSIYAGVHSGQIALPGGKPEEEESLEDAALRELFEETGIIPASVDMLGPLTPLYIPPSRFLVHPFVAAIGKLPALRPQEREIQNIFTVPVEKFNPASAQLQKFETTEGVEIEAPCFYIEPEIRIWGATAMMLSELFALHSKK
jgi:8-oxo-dGTP pyrophosphatase MutT (NUDIX family)